MFSFPLQNLPVSGKVGWKGPTKDVDEKIPKETGGEAAAQVGNDPRCGHFAGCSLGFEFYPLDEN